MYVANSVLLLSLYCTALQRTMDLGDQPTQDPQSTHAGVVTATSLCHHCGTSLFLVNNLSPTLALTDLVAFRDPVSHQRIVFHVSCATAAIGDGGLDLCRPLTPTDVPCYCGKIIHEEFLDRQGRLALWCDYNEQTVDVFHADCAIRLVENRTGDRDGRATPAAPFAAKFASTIRVFLAPDGAGGSDIDGIPLQVGFRFIGQHPAADLESFRALLRSSDRILQRCLGLFLAKSEAEAPPTATGGSGIRTGRSAAGMDEWWQRNPQPKAGQMPFLVHPDPLDQRIVSLGLTVTKGAFSAPSIWDATSLETLMQRFSPRQSDVN